MSYRAVGLFLLRKTCYLFFANVFCRWYALLNLDIARRYSLVWYCSNSIANALRFFFYQSYH